MTGAPTPSGPVLAGCGTERSGGIGIAVDPGRTAGLEDKRVDVLSPEIKPAADGNFVASAARAGDDGHRTVGLVAAQARVSDGQQPPDLLGDRREHLLRHRPARYQRRDPPQRRLLLGQHMHIVTAQRHSRSHRRCVPNAARDLPVMKTRWHNEVAQ